MLQTRNKKLKEVTTECINLLVLDESLIYQSVHASQERVSLQTGSPYGFFAFE